MREGDMEETKVLTPAKCMLSFRSFFRMLSSMKIDGNAAQRKEIEWFVGKKLLVVIMSVLQR